LIHNAAFDDYLVTVLSAGSTAAQRQTVFAAIANWNNALRGAPNYLTKYPLHFNMTDDPNANVVVSFVNSLPCPGGGDACNDQQYPTTHVYVKKTVTSTALVTHELGHSLWYSDQYYPGFGCSPADTIMNSNAPTCKQNITATDKNDFMSRYSPAWATTNATYPHTWSAQWNAVYKLGSVNLNVPTRFVEWNYYWQQFSDTNGGQLSAAYDAKDNTVHEYTYNLGSRYCVTSKLYNEVGYPGAQSWSPRSQYSCVGAAQREDAGFFLATSDRTGPSSGTLYIRVKNFSGGTRNLGIFGPNFENIGCDYYDLANGATRECYISLGRGAYPHLNWYAWDGGLLSWGSLEFE